MQIAAGLAGIVLILVVLWEGFETVVLPRRVTRRFRLTRVFYRRTWGPWCTLVHSLVRPKSRETWLSIYGPLSLLVLFALWAGGLIAGFALLYWCDGSTRATQGGNSGLWTDLYFSCTTFITLGLGDVVPTAGLSRFLAVIESGMGFGFLALVIGYLPGLNQSFARREVSISLLDARAGSPPAASEILLRHSHERGMESLRQLLKEWESWAAEFLEAHLSYPVLAYFRSQHDNQSWLAALTAILDTAALVMVGVEGACQRQAELTFAMARHAVVDLSLVFNTPLKEPRHDRLPGPELSRLRSLLAEAGVQLCQEPEGEAQLRRLRWMYEPYLFALSRYFRAEVPPFIAVKGRADNWQANLWERRGRHRTPAPGTGNGEGEHF